MKADLSRVTFNSSHHFSRVLMQQGRVQLDADWNEQTSILIHFLRTLAADLIGPHGGPADVLAADGQIVAINCGFEIITDPGRIDAFPDDADAKGRLKELLDEAKPGLLIGKGHYYVGGILCENDNYTAYNAQAGYPFAGDLTLEDNESYLLYLDVWERHVTYVENQDKNRANPDIREVALNGPDTATRAQVVWQVRTVGLPAEARNKAPADLKQDYPAFLALLGDTATLGAGLLKARARMPEDVEANPCTVSPSDSYRGPENQLYRVEIHTGGVVQDGAENSPTFVWSRENGSVIYPILELASDSEANTLTVTLESLGRDARFGLAEGNVVEIVDDDYALQNRAEPLLTVTLVDLDEGAVTLEGAPASTVGTSLDKHPFLRRWDGQGEIVEGDGDNNWLSLEDGVQIQFQPSEGKRYRTGDYWLIPARTATGDVEWPGETGAPEAVLAHGVKHYYAPLATVAVGADGKLTAGPDCRRKLITLWS